MIGLIRQIPEENIVKKGKTMSTIITVGAARLANLQINILQKLRDGKLSIEQLDLFNNLSPEEREARFGDWKKPEPAVPAESTEKFALLKDLGIITVPYGYDQKTVLDNITDAKLYNPTRILKPGDKFHVRVFQQVVDGMTTSEERMAFLVTQKVIYTGGQGMFLVFKEKRGQLPTVKCYTSFDEKECLRGDADGHHVMLSLYLHHDGTPVWYNRLFESFWIKDDVFLCYSEVE